MNNTSKNASVRKAVSIFLAFLMSIFLTLMFFLSVLSITVFNSNYLNYQINNTAYAPMIVREMDVDFVSYGTAGGFSEAFFTSVLSSKRVHEDLDSEIRRIYFGDTKGIDSASFQAYLFDSMIEDAKKRGIEVTDNDKKYVQELAALCTDAYVSKMRFPIPSFVTTILVKAKAPLIAGICVLAGLVLILGFIIRKINFWRRRTVRYYLYAAGGSMLMLAVPALIVLFSGKIAHIGIVSRPLYNLTVGYMTDFVWLVLICAAIMLLTCVGLFLIRLHFIRSAEKKEKLSRESHS